MSSMEREMMGLLVNGASTQLQNIQVSFFLVTWSAMVLGMMRMVRHGKEKKGYTPAGSLRELAQDFAEKNEKGRPTKTRPIRR